jgi:hypothetical protein
MSGIELDRDRLDERSLTGTDRSALCFPDQTPRSYPSTTLGISSSMIRRQP